MIVLPPHSKIKSAATVFWVSSKVGTPSLARATCHDRHWHNTVTMPYNFYIQMVFIKEDRLSIRHAVALRALKSVMGPGRVGSGRAANTRTRSARCARSRIVINPSYELRELCIALVVEPFSGVEIHMEMDMEWKWMEMGHNLWKYYGLVWIWGRSSA